MSSVTLALTEGLALSQQQIGDARRHTWFGAALVRVRAACIPAAIRLLFGRGSHVLRKDVVKFRGLAMEVADTRANISGSIPDEVLGMIQEQVDSLGKAQHSVMMMRQKTLSFAQLTPPSAKAQVESFARAASDLFDAIDVLRWEFLELQATGSPICEGYAASSPEQLDEVFAKMSIQ